MIGKYFPPFYRFPFTLLVVCFDTQFLISIFNYLFADGITCLNFTCEMHVIPTSQEFIDAGKLCGNYTFFFIEART